jgi:ABC-type dipeptide/oligopeptide/nickel transport system ATPase component
MAFEVIIGRNRKDVERFGLKGTLMLGRQYVKMGQTTSLSNPVYMDVAGAHVAFIVGKRGSGKCLHGDTLITLNDGSQTKIKDLENNDNDLFTLNDKLKIKVGQKSNFFKRPVNKLLDIGLRSGKSIKL